MPDTRPILAFLDEAHLELSRRVDEVCARDVAPLAPPPDDDAARVQARELLRRLGEAGLYAPIGAPDLRGCCLTREALAAASPLADAVFAPQALGATPILLAGAPALRDRWAAPALRGEAMGAFAMTEPEAGSDVASMRTTARRDGGDYVLDGVKTFISNAGLADFYIVFATTDPAAGHRGISCFVVPADAPGLRFVRPLVLSAPHPLGEIVFVGCRIPAENRLGGEGEGFRLGMTTLDRLRPTVAAAACGMAARALAEALAHVTTREQFGRPLAEFQLVQAKLARMAIELDAARLLTYRAAWAKDRGAERITAEAAMAKAFATEAAQRVVDDAVQLLGGRGVLADHPVDRLYRAVRALRIYEGTTEVQHLVVAREVVKAWAGGETGSAATGAARPEATAAGAAGRPKGGAA
jgi:acyl-CoA dehydrogenase